MNHFTIQSSIVSRYFLNKIQDKQNKTKQERLTANQEDIELAKKTMEEEPIVTGTFSMNKLKDCEYMVKYF